MTHYYESKKVYKKFSNATKASVYEILTQSFILAKIGSTSIYCYWIFLFDEWTKLLLAIKGLCVTIKKTKITDLWFQINHPQSRTKMS